MDDSFGYFCEMYVAEDSPTRGKRYPLWHVNEGSRMDKSQGSLLQFFPFPSQGERVALVFSPPWARTKVGPPSSTSPPPPLRVLNRPSSCSKHKSIGATTWRLSTTRLPRHTEVERQWEKEKRHTEMWNISVPFVNTVVYTLPSRGREYMGLNVRVSINTELIVCEVVRTG